MSNNTTPTEKHFVKIVIFFIGITALILEAINQLSPTEYKLYAKIGSLLFAGIVLWFGKDKVFSSILSIPAINPKPNIKTGTWSIRITFTDQGHTEPKERTGTIKISSSLTGIKIKGGKLLDAQDTGRTTMSKWHSDVTELITYDKHDILYYIYKIPTQKGEESRLEKVGFVCAIRENDSDIFTGLFRDIKVRDGMQQIREGKIQLFYSET